MRQTESQCCPQRDGGGTIVLDWTRCSCNTGKLGFCVCFTTEILRALFCCTKLLNRAIRRKKKKKKICKKNPGCHIMWLMVYWADLPQNTVNSLQPHSRVPRPILCTPGEMCMTDCVLLCATAVGKITNDTAVNGRHYGKGNTRL